MHIHIVYTAQLVAQHMFIKKEKTRYSQKNKQSGLQSHIRQKMLITSYRETKTPNPIYLTLETILLLRPMLKNRNLGLPIWRRRFRSP